MFPPSTPLVLLHGLGTGPEAWKPQTEALGSERPALTPVLRLDANFSIERQAERLWTEVPSGQLDLCGLSLGALVALRMALDRPKRVRRLVLCAGFAALPRRYRALQLAVGTLAALVPQRARGELRDLDRRAVRAVFREGRRFDVAAELERLTMPVLVLVGECDRANRALSKALAESLPTARFGLVAGAGHVANLDAPTEFTVRLRSFLG